MSNSSSGRSGEILKSIVYSYWAYKSAWSMDGLPGMKRGLAAAKTLRVKPISKMKGPLAPTKYQAGLRFSGLQVVLVALACFLVGLAVASYGKLVMAMAVDNLQRRPFELHVGNFSEKLLRNSVPRLRATQ